MDAAREVTDQRGECVLNADPAAQLRLLELQDLDGQLERLKHRRRTHPALQRLAELDGRQRVLAERLATAKDEVARLEAAVSAAEAEVDAVRKHRDRDQARLDAGRVSSPRELESLQHAVTTLLARQDTLENAELEAMEALELAQRELDAQSAAAAELDAQRQEATSGRDRDFADLDEKSAQAQESRVELARAVPADLLALYDRIRSQSAGIGAAALRGGRCEGCRIELNQAELARVRTLPATEVVRCEECRRILVRP